MRLRISQISQLVHKRHQSRHGPRYNQLFHKCPPIRVIQTSHRIIQLLQGVQTFESNKNSSKEQDESSLRSLVRLGVTGHTEQRLVCLVKILFVLPLPLAFSLAFSLAFVDIVSEAEQVLLHIIQVV